MAGEAVTQDAMLPCISCGKKLSNAWGDADNQPSEGTEFRSYGHYGSTFWDSFEGEEIVINVCDECLGQHTARIARQKRFRKIVVEEPSSVRAITGVTIVGRQWLTREMVPYFDGPEDVDPVKIEPEEVGTLTGYDHIEWVSNWAEVKVDLLKWYAEIEQPT